MTTLNWREASEVQLTSKIVPDPNAQHNRLQQLRNVRVAVEDGFLHIDPQQIGAPDTGAASDVYIVPAASVEYVRYPAPEKKTYYAVTDSVI